MTIQEVLQKTTQFFKEKNIETPRLDAEILISFGLKLSRIDLYLKFDQPMSEVEINRCRDLVKRRIQGEPVAYLVGTKNFFDFDFVVNSSVLIPRPETESLVEQALSWVRRQERQDTELSILDLGTGSGCIGISLLKHLPKAQAILVDFSGEAIEVAQHNANRLKLSERVQVLQGRVQEKLWGEKKFDIIMANPPYIARDDQRVQPEVLKYEPYKALFADDQGLAEIKSWASSIKESLNEQAWVGFEFGAGQAPRCLEYFRGLEIFKKIEIIKDLMGVDRHIIAEN